jgi:hypothetical protein
MASTTGAPLYVTVPDALTRPSRDPPPPFLQPAKTQLSAQSAAKQKKKSIEFHLYSFQIGFYSRTRRSRLRQCANANAKDQTRLTKRWT